MVLDWGWWGGRDTTTYHGACGPENRATGIEINRKGMFYEREETVRRRRDVLPRRWGGRGKEVHTKENQSKVQSEKSPAQEPRDQSVGCLMADLCSREDQG